ncbi:MAG: lysophospholipid acyltransferase family protein, partial [Planctomycetota bacterium]
WELGGIYLATQGYPLTVISLRTGDREIAEYRDQVRMTHGIRVLYLDPQESPMQSALTMVSALRNGEVLAMLGDRATGAEKIAVELFHRKYWFPSGPYLLSLITQTPLIPAFVVLEGLSYKLILEEPFMVEHQRGKNREVILAEAASKMAMIFEKYIRRYPNQWYNWYPTWDSEK